MPCAHAYKPDCVCVWAREEGKAEAGNGREVAGVCMCVSQCVCVCSVQFFLNICSLFNLAIFRAHTPIHTYARRVYAHLIAAHTHTHTCRENIRCHCLAHAFPLCISPSLSLPLSLPFPLSTFLPLSLFSTTLSFSLSPLISFHLKCTATLYVAK